jgi:uncharacterized membrane protein YcaP (DUF421 family)
MSNSLIAMLSVSGHTVVIYIFLVLGLSLLDRRETSQLGLVEIVVIMALGSAVETAMVAGNTSLQAGLTAALTLMICNWGMTHLIERWNGLRRILVGHPIPLVADGRILTRRAQSAGLSEDDILEAIRERGYDSLAEVRYAILEVDGNISVIAREAEKKGRKKRPKNKGKSGSPK